MQDINLVAMSNFVDLNDLATFDSAAAYVADIKPATCAGLIATLLDGKPYIAEPLEDVGRFEQLVAVIAVASSTQRFCMVVSDADGRGLAVDSGDRATTCQTLEKISEWTRDVVEDGGSWKAGLCMDLGATAATPEQIAEQFVTQITGYDGDDCVYVALAQALAIRLGLDR